MDGGKWLSLGWRHPLWDLVRYYLSLRGKEMLEDWCDKLKKTKEMKVGDAEAFPISQEVIDHFFGYLMDRELAFARSFALLRSEKDALKFCANNKIKVSKTTTKSKEHHQSSKAVVATVSALAAKTCIDRGLGFVPSPQTRNAWCVKNRLHVTVRNLDGAIPSMSNPSIVWEIKEYWGKTGGGSKMSDAVYECNLVGRELCEFQEQVGSRIYHIVFLDGLTQWGSRKSDLKRFIDLTHQGLIDYLFVGKEIETDFRTLLAELLNKIARPPTVVRPVNSLS
jgi:hypothetical protein